MSIYFERNHEEYNRIVREVRERLASRDPDLRILYSEPGQDGIVVERLGVRSTITSKYASLETVRP